MNIASTIPYPRPHRCFLVSLLGHFFERLRCSQRRCHFDLNLDTHRRYNAQRLEPGNARKMVSPRTFLSIRFSTAGSATRRAVAQQPSLLESLFRGERLLICGAAYDVQGDTADARHSFSGAQSCVPLVRDSGLDYVNFLLRSRATTPAFRESAKIGGTGVRREPLSVPSARAARPPDANVVLIQLCGNPPRVPLPSCVY